MNSRTDQQLLQDYASRRSDAAFAELVRRHVDLVYSTALRMICDAHQAEDVSQAVFVALAQNAGRLADHPVLSGWLHRTTQNLAANAVRASVRRQAREQEAVAMNELLSAESEASWDRIAPHLDTALGELSDADRDALLLRYFERKSAREIGEMLGISDEAAQKRVNRAVERLREMFSKHGVGIGASGLAILISANAVQSAPATLAAKLISGALATSSLATTAATATKTIAMTTLQKTLIGATLVVAIGTGIFEAHQTSELRKQNEEIQSQQAPLADQIQQLQRERDDFAHQLAALRNGDTDSNRGGDELLKLRSENTRLRNDLAKQSGSNDVLMSEALSWKNRVNLLKERLASTPNAKIPEMQLNTEQDWLNAARDDLKTEKDFRQALARLRHDAENKFVSQLQPALSRYMETNHHQFPTDLGQLQPYFESPVDSAILDHWTIVPAKQLRQFGMGSDWIITQKSEPDPEYDSRWGVGPNGYGTGGNFEQKPPGVELLLPAIKSFYGSNGQMPTDPEQLRPYMNTDEQKKELELAIARFKLMSDAKKADMGRQLEKMIAQ